MKFTLLVTTLNRSGEFERMIDSLLVSNLTFLKKIVIMDQSSDDIFLKNTVTLSRFPSSLEVVHKSIARTSLSNARNQALKFIQSDDQIICFPDDDCWYPEDFFSQINDELGADIVDIIQTYYREPTIEGGVPPEILINRNNAKYLHPCSVGIFINIEKVQIDTISFDEFLGVGAELPGGEESDLLFRLLLSNYTIKQIAKPYVYHKVIRERLKNPSYKIHAARFYVMLKNRKLSDINTRLMLSFLKSMLVVFWDYKNLVGKLYAISQWIKNNPKVF